MVKVIKCVILFILLKILLLVNSFFKGIGVTFNLRAVYGQFFLDNYLYKKKKKLK